MRWDYTSLSVVMWAGLMLYAGIAVLLFRLVSKGRKKNVSFAICAAMITVVHAVLLISLGFSEATATSKKVGFEVWACGRQVELDTQQGFRRVVGSDGTAYFGADNMLVVPGAEKNFGVLAELKKAGLSLDVVKQEVGLPVSKNFELRAKAGSAPAWLNSAVDYSGSNGSAKLVAADGKVDCPYRQGEIWNIFVARVDSKNKTYSWQKVALQDLAKLKVNGTDGDDLPDCVVFDYDEPKLKAEYRCGYLLKNDAQRCAKVDQSGCKFHEVDSNKEEAE